MHEATCGRKVRDSKNRKEVTSTHPALEAFEFLQGGIDAISIPVQNLTPEVHNGVVWMRANDPSAGSPTETLLRLLLPLSVKIH
jgi:hypothetical protein